MVTIPMSSDLSAKIRAINEAGQKQSEQQEKKKDTPQPPLLARDVDEKEVPLYPEAWQKNILIIRYCTSIIVGLLAIFILISLIRLWG